MSEELRPCPFCGSEGEQVSDGDDGYFIRCSSGHCDAGFGITMTAREWNTRPIEDELTARIAELEAQLSEARARLAEYEAKSVVIKFMNEDELPKFINDDVYGAMFNCSHVDFVRLFPYIEENDEKYFLILPEAQR